MSITIAEPPQIESRRGGRPRQIAQAWITPSTAGQPIGERIEVNGLNLSRSGVAFEASRPLPEDTCFILEIDVASQRLCSEIRIVSNRRREKGRFAVGAEFN